MFTILFSLMMEKSLLGIIHRTTLLRSLRFGYRGIPKTLTSLEKNDPDTSEVGNDYSLLRSHFSHPVFQGMMPKYDEMREDKYKAWISRYNNELMMRNYVSFHKNL